MPVIDALKDIVTVPPGERARSIEAVIGMRAPAVLVLDQWGEVKETIAVARHEFPERTALVAWARYLATQCPECEGEAL